MVDFFIVESNVDLLDHLLSDFNTLKKFDDYIKVLIFYHFERCEKDDCSQCLFTVNLRYLFTEHEVQVKKDVVRLRYYCIMRKEQFIASRLFIHILASLKKKEFSLRKISRKHCHYGTTKKTRCRVLYRTLASNNTDTIC